MFDNFFFKTSLLEEKKKNNNINSNKTPREYKKIKFSPIVNVKLIPFYHEIIHYPSLWWTPCELMDFRIQSSNEIMELKQKHPYISLFDAQKLLYQPNNISYNEKNFSYYN